MLAPVLGLVALGFCGLVVLGLVGNSVGLGGVVVGALCALLPVGPVVATFLWIDRWEPEPPRLLLIAFLWGACFAALTALLINSSAALVVDEVLGRGSGDVFGAVVIAPVVEEAVKGAFLVGLLIFRRREFDGIVDGIVYAGLVAAGLRVHREHPLLRPGVRRGRGAGAAAACSPSCCCAACSRRSPTRCSRLMTGIGAGIAANSRIAGRPRRLGAARLRGGGDPARAVEQLGVALRRRPFLIVYGVRHGAAVRGAW